MTNRNVLLGNSGTNNDAAMAAGVEAKCPAQCFGSMVADFRSAAKGNIAMWSIVHAGRGDE